MHIKNINNIEKMKVGDYERILNLVLNKLKNTRSKEEIKNTFLGMGLIDLDGNLKDPYKNIYFPKNVS